MGMARTALLHCSNREAGARGGNSTFFLQVGIPCFSHRKADAALRSRNFQKEDVLTFQLLPS